MATITGFITVADLTDGLTGATIVATNENHTYVANADGGVTSAEQGMFNNLYEVYVGATNYTYTETQSPGSNLFSITSVAVSGQTYRRATATILPTGADIEVRVHDGTASDRSAGEISLHDLNTSSIVGFFDEAGANSATVSLTVNVNIAGTSVAYTKILSLSKAIGGSAPYVRMTSDETIVEYAFGASDPKNASDSFVLTARSFNVTGTPTGVWAFSVDGGSFTDITTDAPQAGHTIVGAATNTSTLTVTHTGYDTTLTTGTRITYRFTRDEQLDQITIHKLEDAEGGYNVVIEVIGGSSVLKNNPGTFSSSDNSTFCDLEAKIYLSGTEVTTGLTYVWLKDGTALTAADLSYTQPSGYGIAVAKLRLGGAEVDNNGANVFSCRITTS